MTFIYDDAKVIYLYFLRRLRRLYIQTYDNNNYDDDDDEMKNYQKCMREH